MEIKIIQKNIDAIKNLQGALINNLRSLLIKFGIDDDHIDIWSFRKLFVKTDETVNILILDAIDELNLDMIQIDNSDDKVSEITIV